VPYERRQTSSAFGLTHFMREVITTLLNNGIDAVSRAGASRHDWQGGNGWPTSASLTTVPGVSDDQRHICSSRIHTRRAAPLGLFMFYGIVREHQGNLDYSGSKRGAVFTVSLPPTQAVK